MNARDVASETRGAPRARWGLRSLGLVLAVGFAFPALYLLWRTFAAGGEPLAELLSVRTLRPLARTLRLAVAVSASTAVLGVSLAWLTVRTDLPLRRVVAGVVVVPLVFPTFIGAAAFIRTLNPGGLAANLLDDLGVSFTVHLRGFVGAWLVLTLFTYPYVYLTTAARLRAIPTSTEEQARVLGDRLPTVFVRVVLPQIAGSISAGTLLVFLYAISDFGAVQLMRYDTLTRAIHTNFLTNTPRAFALSAVLLLLAAAVVGAERWVSARVPVTPALVAARQSRYALGRWRWWAFGFVLAVIVGAVVAPVASLVDWAADGVLRGQRLSRALTIDAPEVVSTALNTVWIGVIAALVAVLAVLPIALLAGRYRDRVGAAAHAIVIATFALPGIVIALALRYWTLRTGVAGDLLYGTMALLVFAYVVRFGSLAMGVTLVSVRGVPSRARDAAAVLGAGRWRRFWTIDVPQMAPGLAAAVGIVALSVMKELPIALLLAPLGFVTLTVRIFGSFEESFVAEAGIMALVLVGLSAVLSYALVLRKPSRAVGL